MATDIFNPLRSASPLIAYIDYKSPYAYLAMQPTWAMADELGIDIDWRPLTLDIASYLGSARLDHEGKVVDAQRTAGQWTKVKYAYHDVRRYGSLRGLVIRGAVKIWDSSLAGMGMLWAKNAGDAVLRAYSEIVFERFWKRELDLEDLSAIESVLAEAGAPVSGFRDDAQGKGRAFYDRMQREIFEAGIFGVPTFVLDDEIFFGREHLPKLRWILSGKVGLVPDISYNDPSVTNAKLAHQVQRKLTVAIDFKSLQSYLAVSPTCALVKELGITIDWQPLIVTPSRARIRDGSGEDRATRHRTIRADYLERDATRYAADHGLTITNIDHNVDSTLAALGMLWVRGHDEPRLQDYVRRVFERYWRDQADLADPHTIEGVLNDLGCSNEGFAAFVEMEGRAELERIQTALRERGMFEVPTYIVDDDLFLGRQHLPLLRALLTSGTGEADTSPR